MSELPLIAATGGDAIILLELGGIFAALALLGRLARRVELPPIPVYLLAGLPFGAGGIGPIFGGEFTAVGATIGVMLLLFMLGLEFTADELRTSLRTNLPMGVADLVLNALPGVAAALLLGWGPVAAAVLGGVTYISSSGVISKAINDLHWVGNRETPVVLSILVLEDLAMTVYLPAIAVILAGGSLLAGVLSVGGAVITATVALVVALRFGEIVSRLLGTESRELLLLSTFGLILLVGGLAEMAQVSAGVGAFLVGIAISGDVADRVREQLGPLRDLFAAVFFVFFGLQIDASEIPAVLGAAALLAVVSMASKTATGWWAARRAGLRVRARTRAAAALTPRGEFSIIIASLAIATGVEGQLGPLAAAYVLITAIAGPLLMRLSDPIGERLMRRRQPAHPAPQAG
ncbi:MAG: cation:proton antiporter [Chloroflexota bacterium]|nr:cation:proton antiporter [Chloroflexota bacterium]